MTTKTTPQPDATVHTLVKKTPVDGNWFACVTEIRDSAAFALESSDIDRQTLHWIMDGNRTRWLTLNSASRFELINTAVITKCLVDAMNGRYGSRFRSAIRSIQTACDNILATAEPKS